MFQTPGAGVGNGSKFRACISFRTAIIAGSFIADWFKIPLPLNIVVKSLLNIIGTAPRICCYQSQFAFLRLGMGMLRILRQRLIEVDLRDVKLT